jgi:hypothetical protein
MDNSMCVRAKIHMHVNVINHKPLLHSEDLTKIMANGGMIYDKGMGLLLFFTCCRHSFLVPSVRTFDFSYCSVDLVASGERVTRACGKKKNIDM